MALCIVGEGRGGEGRGEGVEERVNSSLKSTKHKSWYRWNDWQSKCKNNYTMKKKGEGGGMMRGKELM